MRPTDPDHVRRAYLHHPDRIACHVVLDDQGRVLGFQSLRLARDRNDLGVTPGWGIIGTHVGPFAIRQGVGAALFEATLQAAEVAGLRDIDASIGADNSEGLAYYQAMGFRDYRGGNGRICKRYVLGAPPERDDL